MWNRHGECQSTFYTEVGQKLLNETEIPSAAYAALSPRSKSAKKGSLVLSDVVVSPHIGSE